MITLIAAALAISTQAGWAKGGSDRLVITQTGPSGVLNGLPVDISVPEQSPEPSASAVLGSQSAISFTSFDFSVFLFEGANGPLSDIMNIAGGPAASGGPPFTITATLVSDTNGLVLDPFGNEVGRTIEAGSLQDLTSFFEAPLAGVFGVPLPLTVAVSSDAAVPEPASALVLGFGVLGLAAIKRRYLVLRRLNSIKCGCGAAEDCVLFRGRKCPQ
jgi:hypothetical protein